MDIKDTQHSSSSTSSSSPSLTQCKKRAAGRKKFKETRHPVYRGVRQRNGDKWVCEVREPNKKSRLWLGTFPNPEMAAVAHDVAAIALRGDNTPLNFPDTAHHLPRPASSANQDIQRAALQAARTFSSLSSSSIDPKNGNIEGKKPSSRLNTSSTQDLSDLTHKMIVDGDHGEEKSGVAWFVDEEAIFNMPLLLDSMAEGMLLTPLGMKKGFNWSNGEDDDHDIDVTLWGD